MRHLVELECHSLAAAGTITAAQDILHTQPDVLLHRVVAQFQHLFDCPRLEGVLPAMNQVGPHSKRPILARIDRPGCSTLLLSIGTGASHACQHSVCSVIMMRLHVTSRLLQCWDLCPHALCFAWLS